MRRPALSWLTLPCVLLALASCSDDSGTGGTAGMPAAPPALGEPCVQGCESGVICERAGPFLGLCSADCGTDSGCILLRSDSICIGNPYFKCALPCTTIEDCPSGTACTMLAGRMTCTATALSQ